MAEKLTLKLKRLVEVGPALARFAGIDLKASTAFQASKLLKLVNEQLKERDEQKNKLVKELGTLDANADRKDAYTVVAPSAGGDKEKWDLFVAQIEELDDTDVELEFSKIRVRDMKTGKGNEADIPAGVLMALSDAGFIEE